MRNIIGRNIFMAFLIIGFIILVLLQLKTEKEQTNAKNTTKIIADTTSLQTNEIIHLANKVE